MQFAPNGKACIYLIKADFRYFSSDVCHLYEFKVNDVNVMYSSEPCMLLWSV